jgi:hypothetical protein
MEKEFFSLEIRDDNRLTKIFRIIFGLICIAIAVFWAIYNFITIKEDGTLWITVAFLISFGAFQIYAGFGFASKFIELNNNRIRLKKNSLLKSIDLPADQFDKIELYPLKVMFFLKSGKKYLLRFGLSYPEKIELIKDGIISFASRNSINLESISEF